jgi:hypothetical protein
MSGPDASSAEMPGFPFFRRPAMPLDESVLDALLTGQSLPPDAPEQARTVAHMLASLADPAVPGALAGEADARRAFVRAASVVSASPATRRRASRRPRRFAASLTSKLAAALVAVTVGLGGAAAAAYAGALPAPIQDLAHDAIGAPRANPPAPDAPEVQRAVSGQCAAYERAKNHGGSAAVAAEFARLASAAGGAGKIDGYCAAVQKAATGPASSRHGTAKAHGKTTAHGKPKPHPTPKPNPSHPGGARSPGHAKLPTTLRISNNVIANYHHHGDALTGVLRSHRKGVAAETITLERRAGAQGKWVVIGTGTTAADGSVTFTVAPPTKNTQFEIVFAGDSTYRNSHSNVVSVKN